MKTICTIALLLLASCAALADDAPDTRITMRNDVALQHGYDFYKDASVRAREQGRCVVRITVSAQNKLIDATIEKSSGFANLDWSCLHWARDIHYIAATHNGQPVQSSTSLPMTWSIKPQPLGLPGTVVGVGEIK